MNTSVMSDINERRLTGYLSYCSPSSYAGMPLGSQYIILSGDAQQAIDLDTIRQQIADLQARVQALENKTENLNVSQINSRLTALENAISGSSSSGDEGGIAELFANSGDSPLASLELEESWSEYVMLLFTGEQDDADFYSLYNIVDEDWRIGTQFTLGEGTGALTYTVASDEEFTTSDISSATVIIKHIYGIKIANVI